MKFTLLIKCLFLFIFLVFFSLNVSANLIEDINEISDEIESFIGDNNASIFIGEYASPSELLALDYLINNYPLVNEAEIYYDKESLFGSDEIISNDEVLILIGGKNQNSISYDLFNDEIDYEIKEISLGYLYFIISNDGKRYILFSDRKSASSIPNTSIKNSPLNGLVPDQYIPATAVALGISLAWLFHLFSLFFLKVAKLFLSEKIISKIKKKELKDESKYFICCGLRLKYRELFSILAASLIFAITITYSYFKQELLFILIISTLLLNIIIFGVRNIVRIYLDKKYDNHTEYVFWPIGAIFTLLTAWFGYTLSMVGYISKNKGHKNNNQGFVSFIINFSTLLVSIIFFLINLFYPNIIFQMASILSISIAFIQMMPFSPFSGRFVFKWNKLAWFLLIIFMIPVYIIINLI